MANKTFGELKKEVVGETDLEAEDFVQPQELKSYFNSGIRIVEAELIKAGCREKYLQKEAPIDLVAGQKDYDPPEDCIDTKIRKMIYRNGTDIYTVDPATREDSYEQEDIDRQTNSNDAMQYMLYKEGTNFKIRLTPAPAVAVEEGLRVVYWADLKRYTNDAMECDVPEICYEFLMAHVRFKIAKKEKDAFGYNAEKEERENALNLMRETLAGQIVDPKAEEVEMDFSHYEEHS